jgi:hypothetical protein
VLAGIGLSGAPTPGWYNWLVEIDAPAEGEWSSWDVRSQEAWAGEVVRELSPEASVRFETLGSRRLALFDTYGSTFSFVPGGSVQLGFDAAGFEPHPDQRASYDLASEDWGRMPPIQDFVARVTTPIRKVSLPGLLVETVAQEAGLRTIPPTDSSLKEVARGMKEDGTHEVRRRGHPILRVVRRQGRIQAWTIEKCLRADLVRQLAGDGMRLLTSDEWEHVCSGAKRTLFRWGDDCPCDRSPHDNTAAEARRRSEWVRKGGPFVREEPDWDQHLARNLFGLTVAHDPYKAEIVAEPGVWRGGDGGSAMCGGLPYFLQWLPLATAHLDRELADSTAPSGPPHVEVTGAFVRRAIPLTSER